LYRAIGEYAGRKIACAFTITERERGGGGRGEGGIGKRGGRGERERERERVSQFSRSIRLSLQVSYTFGTVVLFATFVFYFRN